MIKSIRDAKLKRILIKNSTSYIKKELYFNSLSLCKSYSSFFFEIYKNKMG